VWTALPLLQVDAGEAFKFTETYNRFNMTFNMMAPAAQKLANPRDLQFGNQQPVTIRWAMLAAGQRRAFLRTLLRGVEFLRDPAVVEFVVRRRGEFDRAANAVVAADAAGGAETPAGDARQVLTDAVVQPFVEAWAAYRGAQMLPQVYGGAQLHEVHPAPSAEEDAAADAAAAALDGAVPFVPWRYGAADHSMEEAVKLSHGGW
jgi:hypothetical protein